MAKKGLAMMQMIIFIVLILIVAAVLLFIFSKSGATFVESNKCAAKGGTCEEICEYVTINFPGCEEGKVCCIKVGD